MSIRIGAMLPMMCLLLLPAAARAQQRTSLFDSQPTHAIVADEMARSTLHIQQEQQTEMKPEEQMSTSGFFLGIVSMIAGAAIASSIAQDACPDRKVDKDCISRRAYTGALMAGTATVSLGVHLVAPKKHGLLASYALNVVEATGLYFAMRAVPGSPIAMAPFMALPVQVFTAVKVQKQE